MCRNYSRVETNEEIRYLNFCVKEVKRNVENIYKEKKEKMQKRKGENKG